MSSPLHTAPVPSTGSTAPAPRSAWRRLLGAFATGGLGVAIGFGFTAALLFSSFFITPFVELMVRTIFVALMLLLAFEVAQRWPDRRLPRWLPRWVFTLVLLGVMAPLATLMVALASVAGDLNSFVGNEARVRGFVIVTSTALTVGMLVALAAQLRQREALSREQALRFALEKSQFERQALDASLTLLQAQVQPHFLFNTLANVQALVESNSPRAAEVLKSLIAYLRASVPRLQGGMATLTDELTLVRAYLELMQMRMPDRLQFTMHADPALGTQPLPPLVLLTLVENAVRHGIDPGTEGGRIEISAALDGQRWRLWVEDSGVGMAADAPAGMGLSNLRARLAGHHGAAASLILSEVQPHGVRAELSLPLQVH